VRVYGAVSGSSERPCFIVTPCRFFGYLLDNSFPRDFRIKRREASSLTNRGVSGLELDRTPRRPYHFRYPRNVDRAGPGDSEFRTRLRP